MSDPHSTTNVPLQIPWGIASLDRMVSAVENVRRRLLRATAALRSANVDYAIAGGNAVASWVSRIDPGAVRNTPDVDILIRRSDFAQARTALESAGFIHWNTTGLDVFLDGPQGKPRDGVHILFAREMIWPDEPSANPDVTESEDTPDFRVLSLDALVRVKLTAYRRKDQVHLLDMIEVGLVDSTWIPRLPAALAARLQHLFDTPGE